MRDAFGGAFMIKLFLVFIAIYIGKEMTDYTYSELGYEFGGKDHSTIMHAYNDIEEKIKIDPSLKNKVKYLMDEVRKYKN